MTGCTDGVQGKKKTPTEVKTCFSLLPLSRSLSDDGEVFERGDVAFDFAVRG